MIAAELKLKPGAGALVDELASKHRLCVASGPRLESIEACLKKFSLLHHFDHLCSAAEVKRSKHYPDIYLNALELLETETCATVGLEDSPTGLAAAKTAGIACVVCPDEFLPKPDGAFTDASLLVNSLSEINAGLLEQLLSGTYDACNQN